MKVNKYFIFKVTGLLGFLYATIKTISFVIRYAAMSKRNTGDFLLLEMIKEQLYWGYLLLSLVLMVLLFILYYIGLIGDDQENKSLHENYVVGCILIVLGLIQSTSLYITMMNYHDIKKQYMTVDLLEYYRLYIKLDIMNILLPIFVGIILISIPYLKAHSKVN